MSGYYDDYEDLSKKARSLMNWQDELRKKLDALQAEGWSGQVALQVPCDWKTVVNLGFVVGHANERELGGMPPGRIALSSVQSMGEQSDGVLYFLVSRQEWPDVPRADLAAVAEGQ